MSKEHWDNVEHPRLKQERKDRKARQELEATNAAAHSAVKSTKLKRIASESLLPTDSKKADLVEADLD